MPQTTAEGGVWVQKKNNLDLIRFFLASSVIFGHSYQILLPAKDQLLADPSRRLAQGQMYIGDFAVDMFFVISGYLILMSWERHPKWNDFLKNRLLRIYPGYLVAFLLTVLLFGVLGTASTAEYLGAAKAYGPIHWLREVLLIHPPLSLPTYKDSFLTENLNAPMWTLIHEFKCYLGLMVFGLLGIYREKLLIPILVAIGAYWLKSPSEWFLPAAGAGVAVAATYLPRRLVIPLVTTAAFVQFLRAPVWENHYRLPLAFLFGMLMYQERDVLKLKALPALILPIVWLVAIQFGYAMPFSAITCGYTFLYLGLAAKPVKWLKPDFSYGMYLYGFPAQQVIAHWNRGWIQPWQLTSLAVVTALGFAAMSWYLVESRFLRLKAKTGMREAPAAAG